MYYDILLSWKRKIHHPLGFIKKITHSKVLIIMMNSCERHVVFLHFFISKHCTGAIILTTVLLYNVTLIHYYYYNHHPLIKSHDFEVAHLRAVS